MHVVTSLCILALFTIMQFQGMASMAVAADKVVVIPLVSKKIIPCPTLTDILVEAGESIQDAINALPAEGGTVMLAAGLHELAAGIHINRSHVKIVGEPGTIVRLKDHVNQPVFLVGTDVQTPDINNDLISDITISNLEIDGNQANQDSETDPNRSWIRNNGIDIRMIDGLRVTDVNVHDNRSGGIVASWKCNNISMSNIQCHDNYFDGIALYDSENIMISDFSANNNDHGAGISLDNALKDVVFCNGIIRDNYDVGIFARYSTNIIFRNMLVSGNGNHGAYLSHNFDGGNYATDRGVTNFLFTGCSFQGNAGYGIFISDDEPTYDHDNAVTSSLFNDNSDGCINTTDSTVLSQDAVICN